MDRTVEQEQKIAKLRAQINEMGIAVEAVMRMYEEMIIFTDRWDNMVHPYVINDKKLIERRENEVKQINIGLKEAKRRYQVALNK